MAELITALLSFPPDSVAKTTAKEYDTQISAYLHSLNQLPPQTWSKPVKNQNILDLLNPSLNSLPYLFALNSQLKSVGTDEQQLVEVVVRIGAFLESFDPTQVRYAGQQWYTLIDQILRLHESQGTQDLRSVVAAVLRLDPTAGTFTPLHLRIVRLCIQAGIPSQALPVLDRDIYAYPQSLAKGIPEELISDGPEFSNAYINNGSGFSPWAGPELVLEYYLLGAQIYLGLGNYSRARLFLEYVLLSPSVQHAVSALQVEAYKKWALAGLLSDGRSFHTPKTIDQSVLKVVRALSKPYDALADSFERRDAKKFLAELDKGASIWQEDGNLSLIQEVGEALSRYRVLDLKKTFAALPVSRLASILDIPVDTALKLLAEMDSLGILGASITGRGSDTILRFHANETNAKSSVEVTDSLEAQTERLQVLVAYLQDADRRLQLSKDYMENQKRMRRVAGQDGDLAEVMDLTYDATAGPAADDGDEDIMD